MLDDLPAGEPAQVHDVERHPFSPWGAEVPDRVRPADQPALLIDDEPETGDDIDAELSDDELFPAAEEAAARIVDEPPSAVDGDVDSYTGKPLEKPS